MTNILPVSVRKARHTDHLNYYTVTAGVIVAAGVLVMAALMLLFDRIYLYNLSTLKSQKSTVNGQAALYLDTENKAKQLQKELELLKAGQKQGTHWSSLMTEFQKLTPEGVSVKGITATQPGVASGAATRPGADSNTQITGSADSRRSVAAFQLALKNSKIFKSAEIQSTNQGSTGIEYIIVVEINYDKLAGPSA